MLLFSMAVCLRDKFIIPCSALALVLLLLTHRVSSEPTQDKQALLSFLSSQPTNRLGWNASTSACTWVGVECNANRSFVVSLRLPNVGLVGLIPANTIGNLTHLRVLSLRSNFLSGLIPSDFSNLKELRSLNLNTNVFSGELPPSLASLTHLKRLAISTNNFTGAIPSAVNNLKQLTGLFLENNDFTGSIPLITGVKLVNFNVSNNNLKGMIPATLSGFPASSFTGNVGLCGRPLPPCAA